jgi:hypothetical protein
LRFYGGSRLTISQHGTCLIPEAPPVAVDTC